MKIIDLLEYVDELQENVFSIKTKIRWINQLEAEVQTEILLMAAEGVVQYTTDDMETELIAPPPHDQIYQEYLFWQIALAQGEAERANNASALFNRVLQEYKRFVAMTINPGDGNAELLRYYINAYQIAVKNGFTGTETQWLQSLIGKAGEPGAGLNIVDQVASESQLPEGTSLEPGTGYLVGEGTTALLYIWNGKEWFYKTQLSGKGEKGEKGDTGPAGPRGATGDPGPQGPVGPQGEKGEAGAKGDTGETGPTGPQGDKGEKGETGSGFKVLDYYASLSALQSAVRSPNAGDAYGVGTAAPYDIYIYGGTSGWVNNGPLQGAQGDKGEKGDKGDPGDTGPQGPKGDTGATGPQGEKGETGATGTAGPQGATGPAGATGPQGPAGRGVKSITYAGDGYWNISYDDNTQSSIPGPEIPDVSGYMPKSGGTFTGRVIASAQTASVSLLRNSKLVDADTDPTVNGEINWTYA